MRVSHRALRYWSVSLASVPPVSVAVLHGQSPVQSRPVRSRLRDLLDPDDSWPVFSTFHAPTLWSTARTQLQQRNRDTGAVEDLLDPITDPVDAYRQFGLVPPSMTTEETRNLLKRFTDDAGIEVDGSKDYLTLHGTRRGVGEQYYCEKSPSAAQRVLRHSDPRTTSKMYSHIEASELSEIGSSVCDNE